MNAPSPGLTLAHGAFFLPFLFLGLFGPGWLLSRALGTRAGAIGAFLGSAAILLNLVLALDALGLQLNAAHVAPGLVVVCLILVALAKRRKTGGPLPADLSPQKFNFQRHAWLLIPAGIGLLAVATKGVFHPLSGLDTKFRWDFLARQMMELGNLRFYPPVTPEDFLQYPWCDGIAPLVSSLYFWSYHCFGSITPEATAPVVITQAILLFAAVFGLAKSRGGPAAGCAAVGVLATSAVLLSGVVIGQETGLTALALVGMFLFIEKHREHAAGGWLVWAGIAAGVGGLAREYGIVFVGLGALMLRGERAILRNYAALILGALVVMLPWYGRNWIKTGHPLFSHGLGGLFPANPVHLDHMRAISDVFAISNNPSAPMVLLSIVGLLAGVPLLLGLVGVIFRFRDLWPWAFAVLAVAALWLWSVHQTAGGYHYSMRALTPALALAAVFGGLFLARAAASGRAWLVAAILTLPALDAAQRTLFMPLEPMVAWWRSDPLAWRDHRQRATHWEADANWQAVVDAAESHKILTSDPFTWVLLHERGARTVPFYSPEVRFLFGPDPDLNASVSTLRAIGFRFIVLGLPNDVGDRQLAQAAFFRTLGQTRPTAIVPFGKIYDLYAPNLLSAVSPASIGTPPARP